MAKLLSIIILGLVFFHCGFGSPAYFQSDLDEPDNDLADYEDPAILQELDDANKDLALIEALDEPDDANMAAVLAEIPYRRKARLQGWLRHAARRGRRFVRKAYKHYNNNKGLYHTAARYLLG